MPWSRLAVATATAVLLLIGFACGGNGETGDEGLRLLFYSNRDGDDDIYTASLAGGDVRQLTNEPGRDYEADGSPDGRLLVFASERGEDEGSRLYLMNVDGTDVRQFSFGGAEGARIVDDYPHWSPDGRLVVFQRTTFQEGSLDADVWLIDTDSGEETQLTDTPKAWDSTPGFSSDGGSVLFESNRDGDFDLYRLEIETLELTQLNNDDGADSGVKESPDGSQYAFASNRGGDNEVYGMDADGTNVRALTDNDVDDRYPHWSPDGRELLFNSDRDGDTEVYVMNSDGTNVRRLTTSAGRDVDPHWLVGR